MIRSESKCRRGQHKYTGSESSFKEPKEEARNNQTGVATDKSLTHAHDAYQQHESNDGEYTVTKATCVGIQPTLKKNDKAQPFRRRNSLENHIGRDFGQNLSSGEISPNFLGLSPSGENLRRGQKAQRRRHCIRDSSNVGPLRVLGFWHCLC